MVQPLKTRLTTCSTPPTKREYESKYVSIQEALYVQLNIIFKNTRSILHFWCYSLMPTGFQEDRYSAR